jgi:flagellar biosynthesis/type III secretory pathway protein FliH
MTDGPVIYDRLIHLACDQPYRTLHARLHQEANQQASKTAEWLSGLLHEAYLEGVREGYSQAVRETEEAKND